MCPRFPLLNQVVSLQALPPGGGRPSPGFALSRPKHWDTTLTGRKASGPQTSSLSVTGGRQKGNAVSKQRMAHWIVDAITLAYQAQGVPCPFRLRAHSTRSVASPGRWLVAPHWQIFVELRAGRPLTHSLDSIAFVWNRFPPVFSPQTGRSTEGPRFRVGLLKTAPESPTVDPVRAPPSPRQLDVAERPAPGPHSMNPWEPVEGWVPYVETVRIPYVYFHG